MDRARKWMVVVASIVAVSSSASAFADAKPKAKAKTQSVDNDDKAKQKQKQATAQKENEDDSERAAVTTVRSAEPGTAPPPGAEPESRMRINMPLMITGALLGTAAYIPSATVGIVGRDDERALLAPVIGPWIALGQKDCDDEPCSAEGLDKALLVTSGVVQGAALVAIALSLFVPPPERGSIPGVATAPTIRVTPVSFGRSGAGLGAVGTF